MAQGSTRVVLAALAGNLVIALAKLIAAAVSGSAAMLTEAIHSLVDTGDQVLLLVGEKRGARKPDPSHPLGYGMEAYFWSFIVALMVFLLGGVLSIYEGVRHVLRPEPIASPWLSFTVLGVAAVFEGASLLVGLREFRRMVRGRRVALFDFLRLSKDPSLISVLLEDSAALIGIALASLGLAGTVFARLAWADGAASIAIGLLLTAVALFLANETRSLIAGEAAAPPVVDKVKAILARDCRISEVAEIATLHLGPGAILVALTLAFEEGVTTESLQKAILEITRALRQAETRIAYVYVRPAAALTME